MDGLSCLMFGRWPSVRLHICCFRIWSKCHINTGFKIMFFFSHAKQWPPHLTIAQHIHTPPTHIFNALNLLLLKRHAVTLALMLASYVLFWSCHSKGRLLLSAEKQCASMLQWLFPNETLSPGCLTFPSALVTSRTQHSNVSAWMGVQRGKSIKLPW